MKKILIIPVLCVLISIVFYSCEKRDTEFRSFLNGQEKVYPGKVANVKSKPGNNRVALYWNPSPDPSVKKYIIYWNNGADSITVNSQTNNPQDIAEAIIPNLQEYVYSFTVISVDAKGNRSIPQEINNVKVYGSVYQANLLNRPYNVSNPYEINNDGSVKLNFGTPDTINIKTIVKYTNTSNVTVEKVLSPTNSSVLLENYKIGSPVLYKSSYIPVTGAIDTFEVNQFDTFPRIVSYVQCDKSLFKALSLPNDVYADYGTSFSKLWDGSVGPQSFPNIFHSNSVTLPHHFTFDLGKTYNELGRIEETGRDCCHNPVEFEIWGTNDIANATTTLPANNPGWKAESIAKGWILLKDITRADDGKAPVKFDLINNPPPVRYIRIRVKKVDSGDSSSSNISEITFWDKQ